VQIVDCIQEQVTCVGEPPSNVIIQCSCQIKLEPNDPETPLPPDYFDDEFETNPEVTSTTIKPLPPSPPQPSMTNLASYHSLLKIILIAIPTLVITVMGVILAFVRCQKARRQNQNTTVQMTLTDQMERGENLMNRTNDTIGTNKNKNLVF
jgi:hypothetical protein